MSSLRGAQLGQHGVGHLHVVAVERAVGDAQRVQVGVVGEVFQFVLFVVGVDGNQHGAYLGRGKEKGEPVGHVGGPDTYV